MRIRRWGFCVPNRTSPSRTLALEWASAKGKTLAPWVPPLDILRHATCHMINSKIRGDGSTLHATSWMNKRGPK